MRWYLTAHKWLPQSQEEVLAGWHDGSEFRVAYSGGVVITNASTVRLKMSGVTHLHFVWQREDLSVHSHLLEL